MRFPQTKTDTGFRLSTIRANHPSKDRFANSKGDHDPLGETRTPNVPRHHFPPLHLSLLSRPSLSRSRAEGAQSEKEATECETLSYLLLLQFRPKNAHHGGQPGADDGRDQGLEGGKLRI